MSEPTYGSGQSYDPQQGYGGGAGYGQYGQQAPQYGSGQQPYGTQYGQQAPAGYPSGGYPSAQTPTPSTTGTPSDRLGQVATIVTIIGYLCAGAGLLGFILWLTVTGDATYKFATALQALVIGLGLGGVNVAIGSWLSHRDTASR
ncbi:MAG TPA: hypothetical protein VEL73_09720 [Mycobacteriales bacterium]|nr:hypothetical protein [Mycobacteriales bacterium]